MLTRGAGGVGVLALRHLGRDGADAGGDSFIMHLGRRLARGRCGGGSGQRVLHLLAPACERGAKRRQFAHFLHREGKPAFDVVVERRLLIEIDRHMQQRTRWRDLEVIGPAFGDQRLEAIEQARQVGAPDVAPVDDAERKHQSARRLGGDEVELFGRAHEIEVQAGHRQRQRQIEIVAEPAEIGRQHDLELRQRMREHGVSASERVARRLAEIEREARFVELNPFGAVRREQAQHVDVVGKQFAQQRERIEQRVLALAEQQKGHRPEQYRAGLIAERLGLAVFIDWLERREREALPLGELGHHVVIVCVEPLGHFLRRRAVAVMGVLVMGMIMMGAIVIVGLALRAARQREVGFQRDLAALPAIAVGNGAEHDAGVEHVVVKREIVGRNDADAERLLARPIGDAQRRGGFAQARFVGLARPIVFEGDLEFAARADAWRAKRGDRK